MEFEVGKTYEVRLGAKHKGSLIKAKYVEKDEVNEDYYVIEMISPISWKGSFHTVALNKELKQRSGHGICFIVEGKQILKEVE